MKKVHSESGLTLRELIASLKLGAEAGKLTGHDYTLVSEINLCEIGRLAM